MTPESIRTQSFKRSILGFNGGEVRRFLSNIAAEMETLQAGVRELTEKAARLEVAVEGYRKWESNLAAFLEQMEKRAKEMEVETRRDAEQVKLEAAHEKRRILENAREEADLIRREAEQKSRAFLANANSRLQRIQDQIQQLHAQRLALVTRIKAILQAEFDFIDALVRDENPPRTETLEYSDLNVSGKGLDAEQLEAIVRRLEEMEGEER